MVHLDGKWRPIKCVGLLHLLAYMSSIFGQASWAQTKHTLGN
jgi:hypothetical protein